MTVKGEGSSGFASLEDLKGLWQDGQIPSRSYKVEGAFCVELKTGEYTGKLFRLTCRQGQIFWDETRTCILEWLDVDLITWKDASSKGKADILWLRIKSSAPAAPKLSFDPPKIITPSLVKDHCAYRSSPAPRHCQQKPGFAGASPLLATDHRAYNNIARQCQQSLIGSSNEEVGSRRIICGSSATKDVDIMHRRRTSSTSVGSKEETTRNEAAAEIVHPSGREGPSERRTSSSTSVGSQEESTRNEAAETAHPSGRKEPPLGGKSTRVPDDSELVRTIEDAVALSAVGVNSSVLWFHFGAHYSEYAAFESLLLSAGRFVFTRDELHDHLRIVGLRKDSE